MSPSGECYGIQEGFRGILEAFHEERRYRGVSWGPRGFRGISVTFRQVSDDFRRDLGTLLMRFFRI